MVLIMERDTRPPNERIQYNTMMLYRNIMTSDHKNVARKILVEQKKSKQKKTTILKVHQTARKIGVKIKNVENMSKSKWK